MESNLRKSGKRTIHGLRRWAPYIFIGVASFMVADLIILKYRHLMLPSEYPMGRPRPLPPESIITKSSLQPVISRNIFASSGYIPDELREKGSEKKNQDVPQLSALPLSLIGTLVHSNPLKSIAAIDQKGKNQVLSYSVGKEIERMARIEKIERQRVYFRNLNNNSLEYIEMTQGPTKVTFENKQITEKPQDVVSLGGNSFKIKRADLIKYTNDLPTVLMQARAVPNKDPITGETNGFRLLDLQAGSVFEQLGLKRMDVIKTVNGEVVDSLQKAMDLYNNFRNGTAVKIGIERSGKNETLNYSID